MKEIQGFLMLMFRRAETQLWHFCEKLSTMKHSHKFFILLPRGILESNKNIKWKRTFLHPCATSLFVQHPAIKLAIYGFYWEWKVCTKFGFEPFSYICYSLEFAMLVKSCTWPESPFLVLKPFILYFHLYMINGFKKI